MKITVIKTFNGAQVVTVEQKVSDVNEYIATLSKLGVDADYEQLVEEFSAGVDRTYIVGL